VFHVLAWREWSACELLAAFCDQRPWSGAGIHETQEADLAALGVGRQEIDDLDAGDQNPSTWMNASTACAQGRRLPADPPARTSRDEGAASSTGSPITFMMRPSVPAPTGTMIGLPVSPTCCPRTRPLFVCPNLLNRQNSFHIVNKRPRVTPRIASPEDVTFARRI
jgi:hypothetical protein